MHRSNSLFDSSIFPIKHFGSLENLFIFAIKYQRWTSVEVAGMTFEDKTLALAIIQNVQKLAGGKNKYSNNGNAYWYSGRFPVFCI